MVKNLNNIIPMKNIITILTLIGAISMGYSQSEVSTGFLTHLTQSSDFSPAYFPKSKFTLSLPDIQGGITNKGFNFDDIYTLENNTIILNTSNFGDENTIRAFTNIRPIAVMFTVGEKLAFGLDFTTTLDASIRFKRDLLDLLRGNGDEAILDQRREYNVNINANGYTAFGIKAAYKTNDLQVGVKMKFVNGLLQLNTPNTNTIGLTTSSDIYQLNLDTDFGFYHTDPIIYENEEFDINDDFTQTNNRGLAFDVGAEYQVNEKLSVTASVLNIGNINFKNNTYLTQSNGSVVYNGENLDDLINGDTDLSNTADSIANDFDFVSSRTTFKYSLPTTFFASAKYNHTERLSFGGAFALESYYEDTNVALMGGVNYELWAKHINVGLSTGVRNGKFNQLGTNVTLTFLPFELYFITDNVLGFSSLSPTNARVGINWRFGNKKFKMNKDNSES